MPKMKFIFQAREKEIEVPAGYTVLQAVAVAPAAGAG
jgi:hypothetical protein